jgi:hypothetical protein
VFGDGGVGLAHNRMRLVVERLRPVVGRHHVTDSCLVLFPRLVQRVHLGGGAVDGRHDSGQCAVCVDSAFGRGAHRLSHRIDLSEERSGCAAGGCGPRLGQRRAGGLEPLPLVGQRLVRLLPRHRVRAGIGRLLGQ